MLLSNQKVMEKVSEVSQMIKQEKNFSLTKYIEETTKPDPIDIHKRREHDIRRYDFQRKVSSLRRAELVSRDAEPGSSEAAPHTVAWCMHRLTKRIEYFDSYYVVELMNDKDELAGRLQLRQNEQLKKNLSFVMEAAESQDSPGANSGANLLDLLKKKSRLEDQEHRLPDTNILADLDSPNPN